MKELVALFHLPQPGVLQKVRQNTFLGIELFFTGMPAGNAYLPDTWFLSFMGACICSNCRDQFSCILHQFYVIDTERDHRITRCFHKAFSTVVVCQQGAPTLPDTWFRPVPHFRTCLCSNRWNQICRTCRVFT